MKDNYLGAALITRTMINMEKPLNPLTLDELIDLTSTDLANDKSWLSRRLRVSFCHTSERIRKI